MEFANMLTLEDIYSINYKTEYKNIQTVYSNSLKSEENLVSKTLMLLNIKNILKKLVLKFFKS